MATTLAPASWQPRAPGVWTIRHGSPDAPTLLRTAGNPPRLDALQALGAPPLPAGHPTVAIGEIGKRTVISVSKRLEETLFGLGLNF